MARWMVSAKKADFDAIAARFHISPVTARRLRNRDVTDVTAMEAWLNGTMKDCHAPHLLPDVEQAARCLLDAVRQGSRIRIVGDYDADGICSTVILLRGLSFLGAEADYCIPHRLTDGYGINNAIVEQAHEDGVALLLTCDNGISAFEQADRAKELGIGELTLDDILKELEKPARDPREDMPRPLLRSDVMDLKDLKPGMVLKGTVRNVIDFGAFVDIGVHQDGLVHISQMTDKYIKHPLEAVSVGDVVDVEVMSVDIPKKRIQLTMKLSGKYK